MRLQELWRYVGERLRSERKTQASTLSARIVDSPHAPVKHTLTDFYGELRIKPQSSAENLRVWPNFLKLRVVAGSYGWLRINANVNG